MIVWSTKVCAILCTAMYLNLCPVPNAIYNSLADISATAATAISTTSMSTVRIRTSYSPLSVARSITHYHQCSVEYFTIYDLGLLGCR